MNARHRRWIGWGGALGVLALLGGCATGVGGYDDDYYGGYGGYGGGPAVYGDVDVYSGPSYPRGYYGARPAYPYYGAPAYRHDPRWRGGRGDRQVRPPRGVAVPVPVPVPVPTPGLRPPRPQPPIAQPERQMPGGRFQPRFAPGASPYGPAGVIRGGQPQSPNDMP